MHETLDAKNIKLGALVERGVSTFSYTYDFGDDWRHSVTIESVTAADPTLDYPRFIDGSRRAPPEDVAGIPGFEEFLDAMTNPRHPEHQRLTKWYGGSFLRVPPNIYATPQANTVPRSAGCSLCLGVCAKWGRITHWNDQAN